MDRAFFHRGKVIIKARKKPVFTVCQLKTDGKDKQNECYKMAIAKPPPGAICNSTVPSSGMEMVFLA